MYQRQAIKMHIEELADEVLQKARGLGLMIATAESCTGGLMAAALTSIAGSSDVFERGFVTYSNEAKAEMLGVDLALIEKHGAVSEQVAAAMAALRTEAFPCANLGCGHRHRRASRRHRGEARGSCPFRGRETERARWRQG